MLLGTGVNLTRATELIIVEPQDKLATESQCRAWIHRITQSNPTITTMLPDKLSSDLMVLLRANRRDHAMVDGNGVLLLRIIDDLKTETESEQANLVKTAAGLGTWITSRLGVKISWANRINAVMKTESWPKVLQQYCATRYGQAHFNWSVTNNMVQNRLDYVSSLSWTFDHR
jgi:hypothetical protein